MRPLILVMFALGMLSIHPGVMAQPQEPPEASVIGMVSVDVAAIWDADLLKDARGLLQTIAGRFRDTVEKQFGLTPDRIARVTVVQFKMGTGESEQIQQSMVITSRDDIDPAKFLTATGSKRVIEKGKLEGLPEYAVYHQGFATQLAVSTRQIVVDSLFHHVPVTIFGEIVKANPSETLKVNTEVILKSLKRDADRAAIMSKDKLVLSASFDVPETARHFLLLGDDEARPGFPEELLPLLKARFFTASVSLGTAVKANIEFASFSSPESATAAKAGLDLALKQLSRLLEGSIPMNSDKATTLSSLATLAASIIEKGTIQVSGKTVTFSTETESNRELGTTLANGVLAAEDAAARASSQNNLKQLVLAAHNHADASSAPLIQNICDAKGKPLLSWRVALLPYLEQEELYKQFKLDEPWDSEHNKPLLAKMPKVFVVPSAVANKEGHTFYQTFVGKKGQAMRPLLQDGDEKGLSMQSVTDGLSNTIAIIEAGDAVAWTKPDDLPFDNDSKLPKLGGHFEIGFHIALCDGSVRFLRATTPEVNLKAMITANGGENVDFGDD
ncbi:hypothetical protein BH11PLA2_BH11PLA2_38980 [soil metagenome]